MLNSRWEYGYSPKGQALALQSFMLTEPAIYCLEANQFRSSCEREAPMGGGRWHKDYILGGNMGMGRQSPNRTPSEHPIRFNPH